MKIKFLLFFLAAGFFLGSFAQSNKCSTYDRWQDLVAKDPDALVRKANLERFTERWVRENKNNKAGVVTIPVVVHVLYNNSTQNISDAQVQSQIDVLNQDFRLLNSDSLTPSHAFWSFTADSEIEFCLAKRDPNGNATNGITRTATDSAIFNDNLGHEKFDATGGKDNWDPTKYLNIWVCDLTGTTLGYAEFPSDLSANPEKDGVVIRYQVFGTVGTAGTGGYTDQDLGRTATHEVGHWLNLNHIWGDQICGDDNVADTPTHEDENLGGCRTFPHNAFSQCGSDANGEMYMNYMDYVDDYCMVMFTAGQAARMHAALNGDRAAILTSDGCSPSTGVSEPIVAQDIKMYPNPTTGLLTIDFQGRQVQSVNISDMSGRMIYESNAANETKQLNIDLSHLVKGIYFVRVDLGSESHMRKIVLN